MQIAPALTRTVSGSTGLGIALVRLGLGASMTYHGLSKLLPPPGQAHAGLLAGVNHFSAFIVSLGLPFFLGYASVGAEFLGGLLLLLGLATRGAAFMVATNMLVALFTVNLRHGLAGSEYTLALIVMALALLLTGGGALSLDRLLTDERDPRV